MIAQDKIQLPDNIALRLWTCLQAYEVNQIELAKTPPWNGHHNFKIMTVDRERQGYVDSMASSTREILFLVGEFCKDIKVDDNVELTIARLRAILPPLNSITAKRVKLVDARNKTVGGY